MNFYDLLLAKKLSGGGGGSNNNLLSCAGVITNGVLSGLVKNANTVDNIKLIVSNDVTEIADEAFIGKGILTEVKIPNSVTRIGNRAFQNCAYITTIEVGSSVESMGTQCFEYCSKLATFICRAETPPVIQSNTFRQNASNLVIYVPASSLDAYKAANVWRNRTIEAIPN